MKRCKKYREYISARADGELTAAELSELEKHLESCSACAAFASELENARASLCSLSVKAPAGFAARVSAAAGRQAVKPDKIPLWQSLALKSVGTAAVICIVLTAAFFSGMFNESKKCGEAAPDNGVTTPTLAASDTYGESKTDGAATTAFLKIPDRETLAGVAAVVRGTVVSKEDLSSGGAYTVLEIEVSKQYFSRYDPLKGATIGYSCPSGKDISEAGDEVIVFLSPTTGSDRAAYTATDTVFLYMRVEGEACLAGNFMRLADNIGRSSVSEFTGATERYALLDVEEKIDALIEQYIK